ncbi:uncharacterized protein [Montipora foliosa]|uniref:uncharacterized protein n=1 Tax=Montipora foliosa TaxID=591990 RepID=UPI0035F15B73
MPESVPGTVGVFPRTDVYNKEPGKKKRGKGKTGSSRSKCKTCGQESPSGKKARVYWVSCEDCECWFHNVCVGLPENKEPIQERWYCPGCDAS